MKKSHIDNGLLKGLNFLIQAAKAKARGFLNTRYFKIIAFLVTGNLNFTYFNNKQINNSIFKQYYPGSLVIGDLGVVNRLQKLPDYELVERIIKFYANATELNANKASGVWITLNEYKKDIHNALLAGDQKTVAKFLMQPANSMLMHGFDHPTSHSIKNYQNEKWCMNLLSECCGVLIPTLNKLLFPDYSESIDIFPNYYK